MKKNGRCAVSGRIVARMNDCPGRSEGVRERGSEEESRLKPAERPAEASGTGAVENWEKVHETGWGNHISCGLLLEIYHNGKEYRGALHVAAGTYGKGFGMPFMAKHEPGFADKEQAITYYLKDAIAHVEANLQTDNDRKLLAWLKDEMLWTQQMEIEL